MLDKTTIHKVFSEFDRYNILVIGDVMVDSYLWGDVERISPEAPIPIMSVKEHEDRLGGAANVARNIQEMGANAIICAVIGDDAKGKTFIDLLNKRLLADEGIIISTERVTTVKTRVISEGQHIVRIDEEVTCPMSAVLEEKVINRVQTIMEKQRIDALVFEDYDKGMITPAIIERIVNFAKEKGVPVAVDPKKSNFLAYKNTTLFKPNYAELCEGLRMLPGKDDSEALREAVLRLHKEQQHEMVMVTLSEAGIFISENDSHASFPAEIRDIADVSGAGDTVISIAALCLASGLKKEDIAIMANLAGGLVCEKIGVVPVPKVELLKECLEYYNC